MKKYILSFLFLILLSLCSNAYCDQNNIYETYIGKSRSFVKIIKPNVIETEDGYYVVDYQNINGNTVRILLSFDEMDIVESVWVIVEDSGAIIVTGNDAYAGLSASMRMLGIGVNNIEDVIEKDGNIFTITSDNIVCVSPIETSKNNNGKTIYITRCSSNTKKIDSVANYIQHYYETSFQSLLVAKFSVSNSTNRSIIYSNTRFLAIDSSGNQLQMDTSYCTDSTPNQYLAPEQSLEATICWKNAINPPFNIYYVDFIPENYKTGDQSLPTIYLCTIDK